jgi:hypothetical protein
VGLLAVIYFGLVSYFTCFYFYDLFNATEKRRKASQIKNRTDSTISRKAS